ncbi:MAG: hypothetical protein IH621_11250 [Krumholzibacteria bacterium]|nr:hypothetical protein [Candidatus Krumholzibacteria bacterium]
MPHPLRNLATGWQQLWARESLPPAPPEDRHGPPSTSLLRRLLARESLTAAGATGGPPRSFCRRLLARESLPAAPRRPADPGPE